MAGKVFNIKVCSPLKLRSGLKGNYHAICHYSYNLPLCASRKQLLIFTLGNIKVICTKWIGKDMKILPNTSTRH